MEEKKEKEYLIEVTFPRLTPGDDNKHVVSLSAYDDAGAIEEARKLLLNSIEIFIIKRADIIFK